MDQCQTDDKLGIDIKDEVGEKCEVHGKKPSKFFFRRNWAPNFKLMILFEEDGIGLKLRSFNNEDHHIARRAGGETEPTYHHLGADDMRLNHTNYHVTNPSNKDW